MHDLSPRPSVVQLSTGQRETMWEPTAFSSAPSTGPAEAAGVAAHRSPTSDETFQYFGASVSTCPREFPFILGLLSWSTCWGKPFQWSWSATSGLCRDTDVMTLPLGGRSRPASGRLKTVVYSTGRRYVTPAVRAGTLWFTTATHVFWAEMHNGLSSRRRKK